MIYDNNIIKNSIYQCYLISKLLLYYCNKEITFLIYYIFYKYESFTLMVSLKLLNLVKYFKKKEKNYLVVGFNGS